MPKNPGQSGYGGYKMQKITSIEPCDGKVVVTLACNHALKWFPQSNLSAEEWAKKIQQGINPFIVGQTRIRCNACRPINHIADGKEH